MPSRAAIDGENGGLLGNLGGEQMPEMGMEMPLDMGMEPELIDEPYEEEVSHPLLDLLDQGNIISVIEEEDNELTLSGVGADVLEDYDTSKNTMKDWLKKYKEALELSKLDPGVKEKTFPFKGASTAMLPFILEAMLDFNARSAPELAFAKKIVGVAVNGANNPEKEARAKRVAEYTNYQLTNIMTGWREEQDLNLMALPCVGTSYKKTYYDYDTKEVCSDLVLADEVIFNQNYKTFALAPSKYQEMSYTKNELLGFIRGEMEWDIEETTLEDDIDEDFVEAYTWLDIDDDGLEEPYYIVVRKKTSLPVYMSPLFDDDTLLVNDDGEVIKAEMIDVFTQYRFIPDPAGSPMGMGWGILLGSMFKAINTNLRQQIDANTLATVAANSGLINQDMTSGFGNSVQSGGIKVKMGELTPVQNRGSGGLAQNVVQFPFKGSNATMFQLLESLSTQARQLVTTATQVEANQGEAASLYLARLQQAMKLPNVITMRVYAAAKKELECIALLNFKHYDNEAYAKVIDQQANMEQDFDPEDCDITLVADPAKGSDIERSARSQAVLDEAKQQPQQILNLRQAYIDWLLSTGMTEEEIQVMAPEPSGEMDPMEKKMLEMEMMDAEFRNRDQELREQGQQLQYAKLERETAAQALKATQAMHDAGLASEKTQSEAQYKYVQSLKLLADMGAKDPMSALRAVEQEFVEFDYDPVSGELTARG